MSVKLLGNCLFAVLLAASGGALAAGDPPPADDDVEALLKQAAEDDARMAAAAAPPAAESGGFFGLRGFSQVELAHRLDSPRHWSKMLGRLEFGNRGKTGGGLKWKFSARADYDAVFALQDDKYIDDVRRDQQFNLAIREAYVDTSLGNWDLRLGRQHIVWGEVVGLFFADVVSARDMREFILPEFNILRIPQWAVRAEHFGKDSKYELIWIPTPTYDETGVPGAEFFPWQPVYPGYSTRYRGEIKPSTKLRRGNYGARGSWLSSGWDYSVFGYRSMDAAPTFYRSFGVNTFAPEVIYQGRHDRITQWGGTVAKDFEGYVLKAEGVLTRGRKQSVLRLTDDDGVVPQNTFDWVVSLDLPFETETRLNLQAFQSIITDHDRDVIPEKTESGYSILFNHKLTPSVEAEILWVASLNRTDWMLRPKVNWTFDRNWRLSVGADAFKGPATGLFGRYGAQDRIYSELRYSY